MNKSIVLTLAVVGSLAIASPTLALDMNSFMATNAPQSGIITFGHTNNTGKPVITTIPLGGQAQFQIQNQSQVNNQSQNTRVGLVTNGGNSSSSSSSSSSAAAAAAVGNKGAGVGAGAGAGSGAGSSTGGSTGSTGSSSSSSSAAAASAGKGSASASGSGSASAGRSGSSASSAAAASASVGNKVVTAVKVVPTVKSNGTLPVTGNTSAAASATVLAGLVASGVAFVKQRKLLAILGA